MFLSLELEHLSYMTKNHVLREDLKGLLWKDHKVVKVGKGL